MQDEKRQIGVGTTISSSTMTNNPFDVNHISDDDEVRYSIDLQHDESGATSYASMASAMTGEEGDHHDTLPTNRVFGSSSSSNQKLDGEGDWWWMYVLKVGACLVSWYTLSIGMTMMNKVLFGQHHLVRTTFLSFFHDIVVSKAK